MLWIHSSQDKALELFRSSFIKSTIAFSSNGYLALFTENLRRVHTLPHFWDTGAFMILSLCFFQRCKFFMGIFNSRAAPRSFRLPRVFRKECNWIMPCLILQLLSLLQPYCFIRNTRPVTAFKLNQNIRFKREREPDNTCDRYAIKVMKEDMIVEHLPRNFRGILSFVLLSGGNRKVRITGKRENRRKN